MHLPKVAGKYFNSPFFKMAAKAILKARKSDISWTRLAKFRSNIPGKGKDRFTYVDLCHDCGQEGSRERKIYLSKPLPTEHMSLWQPERRLPKQIEERIHVQGNMEALIVMSENKLLPISYHLLTWRERGCHQKPIQVQYTVCALPIISIWQAILFISKGRKFVNECLPLITSAVVLARWYVSNEIQMMFLTWQHIIVCLLFSRQ